MVKALTGLPVGPTGKIPEFTQAFAKAEASFLKQVF
jgi:hypothetical protein